MKAALKPTLIRTRGKRPGRPVSRRALGIGTGLAALLLPLAALAPVCGQALDWMRKDPAKSAAPLETSTWLVTYTEFDSKAVAPRGSTRPRRVAPSPVVLARDAVLQLPQAPVELRKLINEVAAEVRIPRALLHAVIATESRYKSDAVSPRGAVGLMQLMPATALRFGAPDPYDPRDNVIAGARYLKFLLKLFSNDVELVLAAYNAGHGAVMRAGNRIPQYPETMAYVPKVMAYMRCASNAACRRT
jgi:hypothetical protein